MILKDNKINKAITLEIIRDKMSGGELDNPLIVSDYINWLAACLGNLGTDILAKEILYAQKWGETRKECKTDKEAEFKIKLTEEYKNFEIAKIKQKMVVNIIQALKRRLKVLNDEFMVN